MSAADRDGQGGQVNLYRPPIATKPGDTRCNPFNAKCLNASDTRPAPRETHDNYGRLLHPCDHPGCEKWGGFEFGPGPGLTGPRYWYCGDHVGDADRWKAISRLRAKEANPPAAPRQKPIAGKQGRLL